MQLILIDAVNLNGGHHRLNDAHDPLAHIAIKRVIGREGHDAVTAQFVFDLEIRLAHLHERLRIVATGNYATIIVTENNDRNLGQVRAKHTLAARIKAVAVNQAEYRR